jgi:hypothetical protein
MARIASVASRSRPDPVKALGGMRDVVIQAELRNSGVAGQEIPALIGEG